MQIDLTIELIISLTGLALSLISFLIVRSNDAKALEARITALETKIEPFWKFIQTELPGLIAQEDTPELDLLLMKSLPTNGLRLKTSECEKLISLLEAEYLKAKRNEDTGRSLAIALYKEVLTQRLKESVREQC